MGSPMDAKSYSKKTDVIYEETPLDAIREESAFATEGIEKYYRPVEGYEGIHRWDPDFEWEPSEEKRVVKKVCPSRRFRVLCS